MNDENWNGTGSRRMAGSMGGTGDWNAGGADAGWTEEPRRRGAGRPSRPIGTLGGGGGGSIDGAPVETLADWRDERLLSGGISAELAFGAALAVAKALEKLPAGAPALRYLCPEGIRVAQRAGDAQVPEITEIREPQDMSAALPYRGAKADGDARRAARMALARILHELLSGMPPASAFRSVSGLSAAQNRALERAFVGKPGGSFAGLVRAVKKGKDGRGWIPGVVLAVLVAAGAAAAWGWQQGRDWLKAELARLEELAKSAGGDESQESILKRRAEAGDMEAMVELAKRYAEGQNEGGEEAGASGTAASRVENETIVQETPTEQDGADAEEVAGGGTARSLEWTQKAAEAGDVPSMVAFGRSILDGKVPGNGAADAASWFRRAAEEGNAEGREALAECLWGGWGVARNREEAFRWAALAAEEGRVAAQRIAGLCFRDGIGTAAEPRKAAKWLKRAAEAGDAEAQFAWSQILAQGSGVPQDAAGAFEWGKKAAEQGMPEAQMFVGECLAGGAGTGTPDPAEAVRWYQKAAEQSHAPAMTLLGMHLVMGDGGAKDAAQGVKWLEKAVAEGEGLACSLLAKCHIEGWGVPKNARKAAELLKRGAELGDPQSMGEYGAGLVLGQYVAKNPAEGLRWMEKAAETGRGDLQYALAMVLLNGAAGRVDTANGLEWLERAVASGFPEAQCQLAILLKEGKTVHADSARSFDLHLAAAKAGHVVSQSQLGDYYYAGYGIDRDYGESFRWYKQAAEAGDANAMLGVANAYERGRGTEVDKKEALKWFKAAAKSGVPEIEEVAKRCVARLSADGAGDTEDSAAALRLFRERAESGDVLAMYDLAQRLDAGNGVPKDPAEAVKWWRKLAEIPKVTPQTGALQIGAWAQYGIHLLDGDGVTRDAREAVRWLTKASSDNDKFTEMGLTDANLKQKSLAQRRLAECYARGDGVPRDERVATQWFENAALNGDVESCLETGDRFADGRAGRRDPLGPQRWYERAANKGSAEGAYRAGLSYAQQGTIFRSKAEEWLNKAVQMGHSKAEAALRDLRNGALKPASEPKPAVPATISPSEAHNKGWAAAQRRDYAEAVKWYRQAAEQGFGPSCVNLGLAYHNGQGVPRDYAEAVKWFRKGTESGHVEAQYNLGTCLLYGRGVRKDPAEAVRWFRKAAAQGHANSQHSLGACLVNGDGVRKDYNEAIQWFRKAAAQGNAASKDALRQLGVR